MKNFVMGAKIDPKVVMDLSIFKISGWNILQPSNRKLLEKGIEENYSQLLSIKIRCFFFPCDTALGTTGYV